MEQISDYNYSLIECYDCHAMFGFTESDIIDGVYVRCPDCGELIYIWE